ncbi:MAG: type III-B CRISPR-associated protein Cas10/Cmr2 [Chloracidobacterium sp.]|nr:type III-B CRISPR-associated protein Cas10/Cmr2 [Chloracidobacterium sp.]MDW8218685.1 type III-B CRISPR-associated protein Cas10/Cmr2 [Acidobacteriota bacterium]
MPVSWTDLLLAYLHDPPDKALDIRGHEKRAADLARIALGDDVTKEGVKRVAGAADTLASIVERFPMPTAGGDGERAVSPENQTLHIVHPLSATQRTLELPPLGALTTAQQNALRDAMDGFSDDHDPTARKRWLAVWRNWPEKLAEVQPCTAFLPADTRTPDHTIWHHLDTVAAFEAARSEGGGIALLAFALGPVQRFIEAARSVRDLWSGSMILSWLAFQSLLPVVEQLGPTALLYPALRGNPLLDLWLAQDAQLGARAPQPTTRQKMTPSLPHRFLALVPWGKNGAAAHELAERCRQACAKAWRELAESVRARLKQELDGQWTDWDARWNHQIADYFSAATAVLPLSGIGDEIDRQLADLLAGKDTFADAFPAAEHVRAMARSIPRSDRPNYAQEQAGQWQYQIELVQRSLAAARTVRHIPSSTAGEGPWPPKCTLFGSFEQMGPAQLSASSDFWNNLAQPNGGLSLDGVRIRAGEALCAVALAKRFSGPAFFVKQLGVTPQDLRFPDTWTVAAAVWLEKANIRPDQVRREYGEWNGRWLHWSKPDQDLETAGPCPEDVWRRIQHYSRKEQLGPPPTYYAILKLDGDDLGGWLRGEQSPQAREVIHPKLVAYFEEVDAQNAERLKARRPVGPALHAAISTALANFALHVAPPVIEAHSGTLIYAGGDDLLALLPVEKALPCAAQLAQAYRQNWYATDQNRREANRREWLLMGKRATISGGMVVVHAKDDLRLALQDARAAEHQAKATGKDALGMTVRRRSGEHTSAVCPWPFAESVIGWTDGFRRGASDRWVYRLYGMRGTLAGLPAKAIQAEFQRQLRRAEAPTPDLIPPKDFAEAFDAFQALKLPNGVRRFSDARAALEPFLTLCHTAAFLARGRDV